MNSELSAQTGFSGSYAWQFVATGGAISNSTRKLIADIKLVAAAIVGATMDKIVLRDNSAVVEAAPDRRVPFAGVTGTVFFSPASLPDEVAEEVDLVGLAAYRAPFDIPNHEKKLGWLALTYATQVHACVVEIDEETGEIGLLRYAAARESRPSRRTGGRCRWRPR